VDLSWADLRGAHLCGARLHKADLSGARLRNADLLRADLHEADLFGANLYGADLSWADLSGVNFGAANLHEANLSGAVLRLANLGGADLSGANFADSLLLETVFANTNLTSARGLDSCSHLRPSTIDHRTLSKSGELPPAFLRGVGLPDLLINLIPVLRGDPLQYHPCFISYSSQDHVFAERLYDDLQGSGVRCWFAPKSLKPGDYFRSEIDQAIHTYDKLLLILSKHSIASDWVGDEVESALERERRTGQRILFPIQIDNAVKDAGDWAAALRRRRHIGDMRAWEDTYAYRQAFDNFLGALRAGETALGPEAAETT